jgi:dolichol-phosphate mannosyltransferase
LAGDGKLSFLSRIKYAMDAILSFSYKPLRLSFALFALASVISAVLYGLMIISKSSVLTMGLGVAASVFFMGGLMLLCIGVLGEYLGRVYDEVRNRPLSIISTVLRSPVAMEQPQLAVIAKQSNSPKRKSAIDAA